MSVKKHRRDCFSFLRGDPGGGGAMRYQMATHCQTVARSGSSEHQNIGAVDSFEGKKGGCQLQTKHLIRVVSSEMCLFSLYFFNHMMFI